MIFHGLGASSPALSFALNHWLKADMVLDTAVIIGADNDFQSGNSSFNAVGSKTAPDKICAPTSEPFSTTQTEYSGLICFSLQAAESPAGPAPTTTTSYSMDSRAKLMPLIFKYITIKYFFAFTYNVQKYAQKPPIIVFLM